MQLEFDWGEPEPEPAPSGVPYVPQKTGRKPGPGAVPCNAAGGCEYGNTASMRASGAMKHGGLCKRHGREKYCGYRPCGSGRCCGNLASFGIVAFRKSGGSDPSGLLCGACYDHNQKAERRVMLTDVRCQDGSGECLNDVAPECPGGVHLCKMHNRHRLRGYVPCVGPECVLLAEYLVQTGVPGGQELCNGHYKQVQRGDPLTPLGTTYSRRDYDGCALYMFRARLASGAMVDVFGVTEPAVEIRLRTYEGMSRGRPGLVITEVHGWWRWDDKQTARTVEKKLAELAVHNRSLRKGLKTESWPADDGKVRVALATVMRYSPDYASKGDE